MDEFILVKKKLKKPSLKPLVDYIGTSRYINGLLRNGTELNRTVSGLEKTILGLDKLFEYYKSRDNLILYRGIKKDLPNKYLGLNKAYISADLNIRNALEFSETNGCLIKIYVDNTISHINVRNIYVDNPYIQENEIILPRDLFLELLETKQIKNKYGKIIPMYLVRAIKI